MQAVLFACFIPANICVTGSDLQINGMPLEAKRPQRETIFIGGRKMQKFLLHENEHESSRRSSFILAFIPRTMVKRSRSFSANSPEERHRRVCLPDDDDDDKYDAPHEEVEQQQQPVPEEESSASSDWGWFEDLDSEPVDNREIVASHFEFTRRRHCSKAAVPKLDVNMSELHARVAHACLQKVDKTDQPVLATVFDGLAHKMLN